MAQHILVVNMGSSSGKLSMFERVDSKSVNTVDKSVNKTPVWSTTVKFDNESAENSVRAKLEEALQPLWAKDTLNFQKETIQFVGHRVVHGGGKYESGVLIDQTVKDDIHRFEEYAPLHNQLNLFGIEAIEHIFGKQTKQVAVFDTTFHRTIPEVVARYPLPYDWYEKRGIRRYGFHGISNAYAAVRASEMLNVKPEDFTGIVCHLGSGCSVTAIQNGRSVDTSMGFTPLEGLMMGTRSGSIDPGIILNLLGKPKMTVDELNHVLNHESGLVAVSGLPNDMRTIHEQAEKGNERAKLALEMFVYRIQSYIGAYFVHLKNAKALVFTGGIGEHCPYIRNPVVTALDGIGCVLDSEHNECVDGDTDISHTSTRIRILVLTTGEDLFVAQETCRRAM